MVLKLSISIPDEVAPGTLEALGLTISDPLAECCKDVVKAILNNTLRYLQHVPDGASPEQALRDCVMSSIDVDVVGEIVKDLEKKRIRSGITAFLSDELDPSPREDDSEVERDGCTDGDDDLEKNDENIT